MNKKVFTLMDSALNYTILKVKNSKKRTLILTLILVLSQEHLLIFIKIAWQDIKVFLPLK